MTGLFGIPQQTQALYGGGASRSPLVQALMAMHDGQQPQQGGGMMGALNPMSMLSAYRMGQQLQQPAGFDGYLPPGMSPSAGAVPGATGGQ